MFSQIIPLVDLIEDANGNNCQRFRHILQKACDYVANQKLDIREINITINVPNVYEGKQLRALELISSGT